MGSWGSGFDRLDRHSADMTGKKIPLKRSKDQWNKMDLTAAL